ncbi:MAG TPA: PBSX family phage terminase large subunit [Ignavibacteriales bacterium]|nr:PBSX family phage terminase large subunit [Ignavibacteriales bacterium]
MNEKVVSLKKVIGRGYKDFWKTKVRYRVVKGSRGSKKSTTTALWVIYNMMKYDKANTLVVRKVFKDHKDSTYAQLKWAINRFGVAHLWNCKLSPLEIIYIPTGQKILFRGMDDPMSITSITVEHGYLCWVWFEEFYQIKSEEDFNKVDLSIRGEVPAPLFKQITGTFNPWNERHWLKKRFFDTKQQNVFALTTNYTINEFLGDDDRQLFEEMKEKNPRRFRVEGQGEWGISEGLIYDDWEEREFDQHELVKARPWIQSAFGLDFGYTADPSGLICLLVDMKEKEIYVFDEHYQNGMLNDELADMIKYKGYAKEEIVADSAEPKSIDEIKKYGVPRIRAARKGKDSIKNGIQFIKQFKIIVHPRCVNAILELNNYAWDTKDGKILNVPIDEYNHLMDPMRYALEKFIKPNTVSAAPSLY